MSNPTRERPLSEPDASLEVEADLVDSRERLAIALEASGMGVFDLDLRTMKARTTLRHNEIFGYFEPVPEWSPEIFRRHVVEADRGLLDEAIDRAMETGSFDLTARVRWPDGTVRWMRDWGRVYRDEAGVPVRVVGVTRDVTAEKEAEAALREAKREAEEANRAKGRFLAVMSHELRAPLSGIIGSTDLMELTLGEGDTERNQAAVGRIRSTAWHLVSIVDDLLALARSEAGVEEVHWAEADVAAIAREIVEILGPQARGPGGGLEVVGADREVSFRTDAGKVRQVVMNLVSNAVRHAGESPVTVTVRTTGSSAFVVVEDRGPGIPPEDQARVFEPYIQLDDAAGGSGTGLGLAISRRLARLMGGDVLLESDGSSGCTFTLRLPLEPPAEADA